MEGMRGGEGDPVVGPDRGGKAEVLERALEDGEGESLARRSQGVTAEQMRLAKSVDGQRIRAATAVREALQAAVLIAVVDLVARLAGMPNSAQRPAIFSPCSTRAIAAG
jgi:hypothetical protein